MKEYLLSFAVLYCFLQAESFVGFPLLRKTSCSYGISKQSLSFSAQSERAETASIKSELIMAKYKKLQNQSDIRGVSMDCVPDEAVTLGPEELNRIGPLSIGVGRDCRLSGKILSDFLMGGLDSVDEIDVTDVGLCTTPAMFKSCINDETSFDGSIMITASHLPMNRNGLKFFTKSGGLSKHDISELVHSAGITRVQFGNYHFLSGPDPNNIKRFDFLPTYQKELENMIVKGVSREGSDSGQPLKGFHIIVNASNGMGGFVQTMLSHLGADTTGSLYLEPDGTFPNFPANPELPEVMEATKNAVLKYNADMGIALDTDVDRAGVVDTSGEVINRNKLIAVMSSVLLRDHPGTHIVTDSTTSDGLRKFIENAGGRHVRYMKGYKNVIDKAIELNESGLDCQLAIETSGHGALKENYMLDDGAYMSMKPVEEKEAGYLTYVPLWRSLEIKLNSAIDRVSEWEQELPNYEGLRIRIDSERSGNGWALLRRSLHDPIVILNIESEREGAVKFIGKRMLDEFLQNFVDRIDLSPVASHVEKETHVAEEP